MEATEEETPVYQRIGGEQAVRRLVDTFYDLMESMPEIAAVRKLHPEDLSGSRQKLFEYFSGWFGGPSLFTDKYGHPKLRARHLPFVIGDRERDQWLLCMKLALQKAEISAEIQAELWARIAPLADHMRNKIGEEGHCPGS